MKHDEHETAMRAQELLLEILVDVEHILSAEKRPSPVDDMASAMVRARLNLLLSSNPKLRGYLDRGRAIAEEVRTRSRHGSGGPFVGRGG